MGQTYVVQPNHPCWRGQPTCTIVPGFKGMSAGGLLMDLEELEPRREKPKPKDLEDMSIEALQDYIRELEEEIARAREAIATKEAARDSADSVFRT